MWKSNRKLTKDAKYKPVAEYIHQIVHETRDLLNDSNHPIKVRQKKIEEYIIDQVCAMLSIIKGHHIRVRIYTIDALSGVAIEEQKVFVAKTDTKSFSNSNRTLPLENEDKLQYNTSFCSILHSRPGYEKNFVGNNIVKLYKNQEYNNTLLQKNPPKSRPRFIGYDHISWPLSYKSRIDVPIRREDKYYGFLSVDSPKKDTFSKYDCEIVSSVADALYCIYTITPMMEENVTAESSENANNDNAHISVDTGKTGGSEIKPELGGGSARDNNPKGDNNHGSM